MESSADSIEHLRQESRVVGPRRSRDLAPLILHFVRGQASEGKGWWERRDRHGQTSSVLAMTRKGRRRDSRWQRVNVGTRDDSGCLIAFSIVW